MHVVTVMASKGGAGKSTVSILLASMFAHADLKVLLLDADYGQYTAWTWAAQRTTAWPRAVALKTPEQLDLALVAAQSSEVAFCIIDTAAGTAPITEAALLVSDIVLIPTKCDALDVWAVRSTVGRVREAGKPLLIVPTDAPARRLGREAANVRALRTYLSDLGDAVWDGQLTHRRAIGANLALGLSPGETDWAGPTNAECLRLWRELMKLLHRRETIRVL